MVFIIKCSLLQSLFVLNSDVYDYETRSASNHFFHVPRIFTSSFGNKSIKYICPILWNSIAVNGIAIDNNLANNIGIDQIFNRF